jgi:hypothetical protein
MCLFSESTNRYWAPAVWVSVLNTGNVKRWVRCSLFPHGGDSLVKSQSDSQWSIQWQCYGRTLDESKLQSPPVASFYFLEEVMPEVRTWHICRISYSSAWLSSGISSRDGGTRLRGYKKLGHKWIHKPGKRTWTLALCWLSFPIPHYISDPFSTILVQLCAPAVWPLQTASPNSPASWFPTKKKKNG